MHIVYKLDNLFRSIKVSDENSSVRPAIQNFNNLLQLRTFFASSMQHSKPRHQLSTLSDIICYFSCMLLICFELNGPEIENLYKWTLKMLKLGMVSSFHPHSLCKKVERVMAKTGCTSCTNWTISFEVSGFRTKTHLLHRQFKILKTYYNSGRFFHSACSIQNHVINCQPFLA